MLDRMMADLPRWLRSGLSVTIAAQIGVLPVLVYYFGQISFVSVLANLLIVPLAEPALVIGIILLPFYALIPFLALPFFWILTAELSGVIYLNELISVMPGAVLVVSEPSVVAVSAMYIIITVLSFALYKASLRFRIHFGHVVILLVALMSVSIWVVACRSIAPSHLRITFFDVGQGDSALVQTPDGVKILIDTGPDYKVLKRKLDLNSVRFIDALILSHAHADHASGVKDVFLNFKVGTFYYPESARNETTMNQMLSYAKKTGVRCVPVVNLDEVKFGSGLEMISFCKDLNNDHVDSGGYGGSYEYYGKSSGSGENDKCIISLVKYGAFEVLFTGDADKEMEQYICKDYSYHSNTALANTTPDENPSIKADILKVGHHGSAASSTETFLKNVGARVSVISVGKHNRYGHPSGSAISRIRAAGSRIFRTDNSGDVTVESDGKGFRMLTEH
jgi:competence protein ComEC